MYSSQENKRYNVILSILTHVPENSLKGLAMMNLHLLLSLHFTTALFILLNLLSSPLTEVFHNVLPFSKGSSSQYHNIH